MRTKSEDSGYWELHTSYNTIKPRAITSNVKYLLNRTKPAGSFILCSRCTLLRTGIQNTVVAKMAKINTHFLVLNFYTQFVYVYTSITLQLQTARVRIACPVGSNSWDR